MIVWGGYYSDLDYTNTGGRYNPSTEQLDADLDRRAPCPPRAATTRPSGRAAG